jgi:two-component system, sensor histidine kinase and response regulator
MNQEPASARILVVDDEPRNVELLQDLLEVHGYTVGTAVDGERAIAAARECRPDVILLDVMMPRLNGFEVCRTLKAEPATAMIPVLLVTSLDARDDRLAGMAAGANDFITKPIDSADLLLRVRNAVTTKRLYDEVTAQFHQLQQLETARDTLTHMIVHDLRSPLTGLQGYLDLLRMAVEAKTYDEVIELAAEARGTAGRLNELISQVLDVSRLESHHMPVEREETDLVRLVPAAVASAGPPPASIQVVHDLPEHPVVISCDGDLITRVLVNLVSNAYKFTPRETSVRIGVEAEDGHARITVTDAGKGVAREHRELIFQKFGQTSLGRAVAARSSGLGLTFCKLAVEAHGGRIGVESGPDGGSVFWVELPLRGLEQREA